jgi:hypothetical protein
MRVGPSPSLPVPDLMSPLSRFYSLLACHTDFFQAKEMDKIRKNRGKPLDGRPVPW